MSHVVNIDLSISSLEALDDACKELGLELIQNQKTYRWFGQFVGDSPLPAGFTQADLGKCEHAIRVKGNSQAYEIGLVRSKTNPKEYHLLFDYWAGGGGLVEKIGGNQAMKLKDHYGAALMKRHVKKQGMRVKQTITTSGKIIIKAY